jgi:hypothetical protein
MLTRATNNSKISESHESLLKELIKFHPTGEEKMKGFKHFTVDVHP